MITRVVLTRQAEKDLLKVPTRIADKLEDWAYAVRERGLEEVRKIPGYHDEPLKGRRQGQRSIKLSRGWRAIYEIQKDGVVEFVSVEEVNKHKY